LVKTTAEAIDAATCIGFPVAMKAIGPTLLHKSDDGGVMLSLKDEASVAAAFTSMQERLGARLEGVLIQKMVSGGVEVMLGVTAHPTFGHVVAYGAGGTLVELLADVVFRITPLTTVDAEDMIREARCSKLLDGYRANQP